MLHHQKLHIHVFSNIWRKILLRIMRTRLNEFMHVCVYINIYIYKLSRRLRTFPYATYSSSTFFQYIIYETHK